MDIVVGVTGSIACYKACDLVSALRKDPDVRVHVVMTKEAVKFVAPLTFQTLSGSRVYTDLFEAPEEWELLHTSLAAQAALILVAPATMNVIGKLANGICDDLLTGILFASKAPVLLAPAMNTRMVEHPVTRENIAKLKKLGYGFIGPARGELACREVGLGHIADNEEILAEVRRRVKGRMKSK